MAKNYVQDGKAPTFTAPAGGVESGVPVEIGDLVVVPLVSAAVGEEFAGMLGGVWSLPAANGLAQGDKVSLKAGGLVAPATADSVPFGYIIEPSAGGFATALLVQQ